MELLPIIADYAKQASKSDSPKFDIVGSVEDSGRSIYNWHLSLILDLQLVNLFLF